MCLLLAGTEILKFFLHLRGVPLLVLMEQTRREHDPGTLMLYDLKEPLHPSTRYNSQKEQYAIESGTSKGDSQRKLERKLRDKDKEIERLQAVANLAESKVSALSSQLQEKDEVSPA